MPAILAIDDSQIILRGTFVYPIYSTGTANLMGGVQASDLKASKAIFMGGDFNVISLVGEYIGRSILDSIAIVDFNSCMKDCRLLELPVSSNNIIWRGSRNSGQVWKRLEKIFVILVIFCKQK
ncbi:hypothetical protein ACH5RR_026296 [Cinchona calisaya]|uniref:Uncharacterized protein n=1 Tax=Cinchona calisaya TaxID=153742 RepID=A0ABD2Z4C1_9GENT